MQNDDFYNEKKETEIKILPLEKGGGVSLTINRPNERSVERIKIKTDEIRPVLQILSAALKGQEIVEGELFVESILSNRTRKGIVNISKGLSWQEQLDPSDAIDFAQNILEAAESAQTDEFISGFFRQNMPGIGDNAIYGFLSEYREHRDAARHQRRTEQLLELMPPKVREAYDKSLMICECGENLLEHDADGCKVIGCECKEFREKGATDGRSN